MSQGIIWNDKMNVFLGVVPDKVLAEFLGCDFVTIWGRRKRLGIKSYSKQCKGRTYEEKYGKSREEYFKILRKLYSNYEKKEIKEVDYEEVSKYLRTHTNKQIAKMFQIAESSIIRARAIYKISSPKAVQHNKSKKRNDKSFVKVMGHLGNVLELVTEEGKKEESYKVLVDLHNEHMKEKRQQNRKYHVKKMMKKRRVCEVCERNRQAYFFSGTCKICIECRNKEIKQIERSLNE